MKSLDIPTVAVIADAHLHDIESDYDGASITLDGRRLTLRSWADTCRSSRVFNESHRALIGALDDIVKRGVTHVVLLGDYADDGQIEAIGRVVGVLQHFKKEHGLKFFAIPGNHDYYGPVGKHQSTRFAVSPSQSVLVTSDPAIAEQEPNSAVLTRKMFCLGAPEGLLPVAEFGLSRQPEYLHWETPFGTSDSMESRRYVSKSSDGLTSYELIDASYLVEPSSGLWLLMLDANVFEPKNGKWDIHQKKAFKDSSDAGWNSVLTNKPYLFDWIKNVCRRANEQGKKLLAFSHYPALDPFNDVSGGYVKLFGQNEISRRQPNIEVAEKLLDTGLKLHFGGHMHVNGISRHTDKSRQFTNVSVPSPVACPAAYQLIHTSQNLTHVDTISLASLALDASLIDFYKEEDQLTPPSLEAALNSSNYGEFLYHRIRGRVIHRYFKNAWPENIRENLEDKSVGDLLLLLQSQKTSKHLLQLGDVETMDKSELIKSLQLLPDQNDVAIEDLLNHSMMDLIVDWYCLRDAGSQAKYFIKPEALKMYHFLSSQYGDVSVAEVRSTADFFTLFLGMMHEALRALSRNSTSRETIETS